MNWRQIIILLLGLFCIGLLYFQLPETGNPGGWFGCKTCRSGDPYLPMTAAGYFTALTAFALLCPRFFHRYAQAGLLWAVLLALALTYLKLPQWCLPCLLAHGCHIAIWSLFVFWPGSGNVEDGKEREKFAIALALAVAVVALFAALNLTAMAYQAKAKQPPSATDLAVGDIAPALFPQMKGQGWVINFISPTCPHCHKQLPLVDKLAQSQSDSGYRFLNVSSALPDDVRALAPHTEWLLDEKEAHRKLFKVHGYPTLFVINQEGKISAIIAGASEQILSLSLPKRVSTKYDQAALLLKLPIGNFSTQISRSDFVDTL